MRIHTFGHGTLARDKFAELVTEVGLAEIVDVRSFPGSRRNPQFGTDAMAQWLPDADIAYSWMRELGGRREAVLGSKHVALRHPSFQAYADYMETQAFLDGVEDLLAGGDDPRGDVQRDGLVALPSASSRRPSRSRPQSRCRAPDARRASHTAQADRRCPTGRRPSRLRRRGDTSDAPDLKRHRYGRTHGI